MERITIVQTLNTWLHALRYLAKLWKLQRHVQVRSKGRLVPDRISWVCASLLTEKTTVGIERRLLCFWRAVPDGDSSSFSVFALCSDSNESFKNFDVQKKTPSTYAFIQTRTICITFRHALCHKSVSSGKSCLWAHTKNGKVPAGESRSNSVTGSFISTTPFVKCCSYIELLITSKNQSWKDPQLTCLQKCCCDAYGVMPRHGRVLCLFEYYIPSSSLEYDKSWRSDVVDGKSAKRELKCKPRREWIIHEKTFGLLGGRMKFPIMTGDLRRGYIDILILYIYKCSIHTSCSNTYTSSWIRAMTV